MAAWMHSDINGWNGDRYAEYRSFVAAKAPDLRGRKEDCADLSMMLLIQFAADKMLTVSFEDSRGTLYISKAEGAIKGYGTRYGATLDTDLGLRTPDEFTTMVQRKIDVAALWERNTLQNPNPY